jgi:hypothetical protein
MVGIRDVAVLQRLNAVREGLVQISELHISDNVAAFIRSTDNL